MLVNDLGIYSTALTAKISNREPFFLGRIGGSDTNALVDYLRCTSQGDDLKSHISKWLPIVKRYNGFYSFQSEAEDYIRFIDSLLDDYTNMRSMTVCNFQLLSMLFPASLPPRFYREDFENKKYFEELVSTLSMYDKNCGEYLPYSFIEKGVAEPNTLFHVFAKSLNGLRVLVVCPFSESIQSNYSRRHTFFREPYSYPDFTLLTVNSPITYSGLPKDLYPDATWFDTLARLKSEIMAVTFDLALFSCGTYAMPLGRFVAEQLNKSAIYVGGFLQIFFGIMGRRYEDNSRLLSSINHDQFIYPLERAKYLEYVEVKDSSAKEAFGAYF